MRKAFTLILSLILITVVGCSNRMNPDLNQGENTDNEKNKAELEYPYSTIHGNQIERIELSTAMETIPPLEDKDTFDLVATYIRDAKFVRDASQEGAYGNCGWGMTVTLKEKIHGSNTIVICYPNGEGNELRIGPQGYEYVIESQELGDYIMETLQNLYALVDAEAVPEEILTWFSQFDGKKGAYIYQQPSDTYIKINAGEKRTGGYGIKVKEFYLQDYEKKIIVEFTEPGKNEMVTQVITYPYIIMKVQSSMISRYTVETVEGEKLDEKEKVVFAMLDTPKENAVIGNPVKVKGKVAAFEGSFVVRVLDAGENVIKEQVLQTAGAPSWGDFESSIEYPAPATESGSIEIGEYSAKDGEYIPRTKTEVKFNN